MKISFNLLIYISTISIFISCNTKNKEINQQKEISKNNSEECETAIAFLNDTTFNYEPIIKLNTKTDEYFIKFKAESDIFDTFLYYSTQIEKGKDTLKILITLQDSIYDFNSKKHDCKYPLMTLGEDRFKGKQENEIAIVEIRTQQNNNTFKRKKRKGYFITTTSDAVLP